MLFGVSLNIIKCKIYLDINIKCCLVSWMGFFGYIIGYVMGVIDLVGIFGLIFGDI